MNILKKHLISLILIFTMLLSINVFAADPVYVKLNGVLINYEDAKPQIINQRAMVPFRKTAETLGATIDWNKQTETATFKKGDRVVVHTMRSNIITVNGKAYTFDTPSTVIQNRTVMPVRMLAEALGNPVTWDNATRTVNILADNPTVYSITPDKTTVNTGEKINIAVATSSTTDRIKIVDINENNALIAEANTYSTTPDGNRLFSVPWTPNANKSTFKSLKVVPGNLTSYNEDPNAYKVVAVNVNVNITPKITSFKSDKTSLNRGEKVKLTLEANSYTDKIKITNNKNNNVLELAHYRLENNDTNRRIFETEISFDEKADIELKASPGSNAKGYENTTESLKITVGGGSSSNNNSSSSSNEKLKIKDWTLLNDIHYLDENTKLIVKTTTDIERVEILDENNKVLTDTRYPSIKKNNEHIWELDVPVKVNGRNRISIVAYNKDKEKTSENINFNASTYNTNAVIILNVQQRDLDVSAGDEIRFRIRTTEKVESVKVLDGSTEVVKVTDPSSRASAKEWDVKVKVTENNKNNLKIEAYDKDNNRDTVKLNVFLNTRESGQLNDFNLRTPEVYKNEYIRVDVYTNKAISKVWIEDDNYVKVANKTTYDTSKNDEYTWEFRFPADYVGSNVRYTIVAEDTNGKKYEKTFRVNVKN